MTSSNIKHDDLDLLCLQCRGAGHKISKCPNPPDPGQAKNSPGQEENSPTVTALRSAALLKSLPRTPSHLCDRCKGFNILEIFSRPTFGHGEIDVMPLAPASFSIESPQIDRAQFHRVLGCFRDIQLRASCPLCRLIFCIFPSTTVGGDGDTYYLRPFRSCGRMGHGLFPKVLKPHEEEYAIYFSVDCQQDVTRNIAAFLASDIQQVVHSVVYGFGLAASNPAPNRRALATRVVGDTANYSVMRSWLAHCDAAHGGDCKTAWSDEVLTSRMIDVTTRTVVDCPGRCKYVALSYVWGGVKPDDDALSKGTLPQTIEDAIAVTTKLGAKYLWVDALCVDQTPTPQQTQQLAIMDTIYGCAWVTIIAMASANSNSGLPGVSAKNPRVPQACEVIEGRELAMVFPVLEQELAPSSYVTRAWTFQEHLLSRRQLLFSEHQVHFWCHSARFYETVDESVDPGKCLELPQNASAMADAKASFKVVPSGASAQQLLSVGEDKYRQLTQMYTKRKLTCDSDSLNACLGALKYLESLFFPRGFVWGLPLHDFPQSLRWYHPRGTSPRRRPDFPSWSWVGWEGEMTYSDPLDVVHDATRPWRKEEIVDVAKFVGISGQILTLDAALAKLEVRNEFFGSAYVPGTDEMLGSITKGNFMEPGSVPDGIHDFLVVERRAYYGSPKGPLKQDIYMVLLGWEGNVAVRKAKVHLFLDKGAKFPSCDRPKGGIRIK